MERCNSCVIPKSSHSIRFDGDTCLLCSSHKGMARIQPDPTELESCIERIREAGKGRKFDCIVGVSGGRDSTYLLHQLVRKHGLRCLAAYHRTPFTPDVIDANVRRLTQGLGVPLIEMDISKEYHRKFARKIVLLWFKKPSTTITNTACAPCKQHNREILKIAKKNGVKYLIMGSNIYEDFQLTSGHLEGQTNNQFSVSRKIKQTLMLFRKGIRALTQSTELWQVLPMGIKSVLCLSPDAPLMRFLYSSVKNVNYFYYSEWNEKECEKALAEVGWELPVNCNSSWRADCAFAEVKNYMFQKLTGITYADGFFANLVREGVVSREEALRRVEIEGRPSPGRLAEACNILKISTELFT